MRDLSALRATTDRTPPPGGLDAVLGTARRRARNRVAGSTVFVAVATLVALAGPSAPDSSGLVEVDPARTTGASAAAPPIGHPTAGSSTEPSPSTAAPSAGGGASPAPGPAGDPAPEPAPSPTPTPSASPSPEGERPAAYAYEPYSGYVPPPNTADPCVNQDDESELTGWCAHAGLGSGGPRPYRVAVGERTDVHLKMCRAERATPATITRSGARWFTVTARDAAGEVAWHWDAGGPPAEQAVQVSAGDCLTWRVHWHVRLPKGEYRVQVRFSTDEYRADPDANTFTVEVLDPA